jgi:hypothetical protein
MIEIILFAFLYNAIFQNLSIFYETKIAQNFTSAIHLVICLVLNLIFYMTNNLWIYHLASIMTIGHYLFDIFYLLFFKQMSLMTAALIYHHVATMIYVQYNPYLYLGHIVLIFAEISNIPALFIYHYLKLDPKSKKLNFWLTMQKIVYIGIRIPVFTYLVYKIWIQTHDILAVCICGPVFLMGIIWSMKLIK